MSASKCRTSHLSPHAMVDQKEEMFSSRSFSTRLMERNFWATAKATDPPPMKGSTYVFNGESWRGIEGRICPRRLDLPPGYLNMQIGLGVFALISAPPPPDRPAASGTTPT